MSAGRWRGAARAGAAALAGIAALAVAASASAADVPASIRHLSRPAAQYASNCAGCHGPSGRSVSEIPTLVDRVGYFARIPAGRAYLAEVPNVAMSALGDADLAAMLSWLLRTYSAAQLPSDFRDYTAAEVAGYRQQRIIPWERRQELVRQLLAAGAIPSADALQ
jgi:mono/diheme cytochrome c family protein